MFLMKLEINKAGWSQQHIPIENQWTEDDEENYYNINLDKVEDVREIFWAICRKLEDSNFVRFRVEGFGNLPWPVDVATDFMILLEQFSEFLQFLHTLELNIGYLDFYEQGVETKLIFTKEINSIKINCRPLYDSYYETPDLDWAKESVEEIIEKESLENMIYELIRTFVSIANELCPEFTNNKYFQEWCNDKYISKSWQ